MYSIENLRVINTSSISDGWIIVDKVCETVLTTITHSDFYFGKKVTIYKPYHFDKLDFCKKVAEGVVSLEELRSLRRDFTIDFRKNLICVEEDKMQEKYIRLELEKLQNKLN